MRENREEPLASKTWLLDEPSIEEILKDPIIQLLMRRDGVSEDDLRKRLRSLLVVPYASAQEGEERSLVA